MKKRMAAIVSGLIVCTNVDAMVSMVRREAAHPRYELVVAEPLRGAEVLAVEELRYYLSRILKEDYEGAGGDPVAESKSGAPLRPRIYIGDTAFARACGIHAATLPPDGWVIKNQGRDLILAGGHPRGTLNAVYEFLERDCDVHWFDRDSEFIPENPGMQFSGIARQGSPDAIYRCRWTHAAVTDFKKRVDTDPFFLAERRFMVRNRCPNFLDPRQVERVCDNGGRDVFLRDGGFEQVVERIGHGVYDYVGPREFWTTHPEYFGYTRENAPEKFPDPKYQWGMLCMTHPDVRRLTVERLKKRIADESARSAELGLEPARLFSLGQEDQSPCCPCEGCRSFIEKHGTGGDLVADFWNHAADAIRNEYPDVTILGMAYNWSLEAPRTVRLRDNIAVIWCNWGWRETDGGDDGPFLDQPLDHPVNQKRMKTLQAWADAGARLFFWDYPLVSSYPAPMVLAPYTARNLEIVNRLGVKGVFQQSNEGPVGEYRLFPLQCRGPWNKENFYQLRVWLSLQLMWNAKADAESLTGTFFRCYYGPAERPMRRLYDRLVEVQSLPRRKQQLKHRPATMDYLTPAFFETALSLCDEAAAACSPESTELARVEQERVRIYISILELWGDLQRRLPAGGVLPFDRDTIVARFEQGCRRVAGSIPWVEADRSRYDLNMESIIRYYKNRSRPDRFAEVPDCDYLEVDWRFFNSVLVAFPASYSDMPADSDAVSGRALSFPGRIEPDGVEFVLNTQPALTKKVVPADMESSKGYRLVYLGRSRLLNNSNSCSLSVRFSDGKADSSKKKSVDLMRRVRARDAAAEWDVYVSWKPVRKGEIPEAEPGVLVERVILVRAVPGTVRPPEEDAFYQKWMAENSSEKGPQEGVLLLE